MQTAPSGNTKLSHFDMHFDRIKLFIRVFRQGIRLEGNFSSELINNTIDILYANKSQLSHIMLPRIFFHSFASSFQSLSSLPMKNSSILHWSRCKIESINKLETLKFMTFKCNFHIVIHVTGLEIIFYILKKK